MEHFEDPSRTRAESGFGVRKSGEMKRIRIGLLWINGEKSLGWRAGSNGSWKISHAEQ